MIRYLMLVLRVLKINAGRRNNENKLVCDDTMAVIWYHNPFTLVYFRLSAL